MNSRVNQRMQANSMTKKGLDHSGPPFPPPSSSPVPFPSPPPPPAAALQPHRLPKASEPEEERGGGDAEDRHVGSPVQGWLEGAYREWDCRWSPRSCRPGRRRRTRGCSRHPG